MCALASLVPSSPAVVPAVKKGPGTSAYAVPSALQQFFNKLEGWAIENERKALQDRCKFWSLKALAILTASGSGVIALMNKEPGLSLAVPNGITFICIILDGIMRPGKYRNTHLRIAASLWELKGSIERRWQKADFQGNASSTTLAEILEDGWKELKEIIP